VAAADVEGLAGEPARLMGGEEDDHVGDIVRLTDAAELTVL
jgi:hypothetical protein